MEEVKTYPTNPDESGFFFRNSEEEEAGILTAKDGSKRCYISDGRAVDIRRMKGRDFIEFQRLNGSNQDQASALPVMISVASTVDGKRQPVEFYLDDLYQDDFVKIMAAYTLINFSSGHKK